MYTIDGREWLTPAEAARWLEVSISQVRNLARSGRLHWMRERRQLYVDAQSVREYQRTRGAWRPAGIVGGKPAARRLGVQLRLPGTGEEGQDRD